MPFATPDAPGTIPVLARQALRRHTFIDKTRRWSSPEPSEYGLVTRGRRTASRSFFVVTQRRAEDGVIARNLLVVAFGAADTLARYALQGLVQYPAAQLSAAWVMRENCRPKRMKGYGVLNAHVRAALEDHIE